MSIRIERQDAVTTVIIDRPERKNAVDGPSAQALADAFRDFERDGAARFAAGAGRHGTYGG